MRRRQLLQLMLALGAAGPARAARGAESPNHGPFRTSTIEGDSGVMLQGHDAVAYFTRSAAIRGDPAHSLRFQGVTWHFASAESRSAFEAAPQKYMPQFGGFCSNGINYAIPWGGGGGPETWRIYRGRLYVFGGQRARDHFEMDTERNLELAHRYWDDEVAGSTAIVQRLKRLVLRVPHYRTDAQLQAEWEARRAAGTLPVMPGAAQVVSATP